MTHHVLVYCPEGGRISWATAPFLKGAHCKGLIASMPVGNGANRGKLLHFFPMLYPDRHEALICVPTHTVLH